MKSPLRYPGGKTRAIKTLTSMIDQHFNGKRYSKMLSPFCGGCSFEFVLLDMFKSSKFVFADLFKPLIIFWQQCMTNKNSLIELLTDSVGNIDKEQFQQIRNELIKHVDDEDPILIAAYYFIINRCSFSGSTFSGGFSQEAAMKRFTKSSVSNIERLKFNKNVSFLCQSFETTLTNINENDFIFADPPYHLNEKSKLYGINGDLHENFNHQLFHDTMESLNCDYIITYNDDEYIRTLYHNHVIISASWSYGMNKSHQSSEIIILSKQTS